MDQALKEMDNDGLNSLKYSAEVTEYPLFTLIRANLETLYEHYIENLQVKSLQPWIRC